MPTFVELVQPKVETAVARGLFALPGPAKRLLAGSPITVDGQRLALEAQLLLKLQQLGGQHGLSAGNAEVARAAMRRGSGLFGSARVPGVVVADRSIPGPHGALNARVYRPRELTEPGDLLVFYHGGGWVIGDLDTHDDLCRFLARHAGVRVLSVEYRLAPEFPFPAAYDDALHAYRFAVEHAEELGSSRERIAVGGDSAGGNLAASVAVHAATGGLPRPSFQLLIYPAVDATTRRPSRELFGNGFLLTDGDMDWFMGQYAPSVDERGDPRLSVLLAEDVSAAPPAHVVTAGFDPLRDEGEAYAERLAGAGVPVVTRRFPDLIHGFASLGAVGGRFREALFEIAGALRAGLALR
ncbi:alpha/beta hydrolase [Saccharopolyspora sp. CA-218241]|uniref:alpha/beta hydrolase n=1 Tax=Saccharopolyspora sp. CA-218241 TaxID=3240027 RepID=UPI003D951CD4